MKTKEEIEKLALAKYPIEMVSIFTMRDKTDKNKERRKIFIETYQQALDENCDIHTQIKEFEDSLEKESGLITEAVNDVIIIATLNKEDLVFDMVNSQFLVISRQDLNKESFAERRKIN